MGSLHSVSNTGEKLAKWIILKADEQFKKAEELEPKRLRQKEEVKRLKAIAQLSRKQSLPMLSRMEKALKSQFESEKKSLTYTRNESRILRMGSRISLPMIDFRSTKTGKAIRIATGGPKLWIRSARVRKSRKK